MENGQPLIFSTVSSNCLVAESLVVASYTETEMNHINWKKKFGMRAVVYRLFVPKTFRSPYGICSGCFIPWRLGCFVPWTFRSTGQRLCTLVVTYMS